MPATLKSEYYANQVSELVRYRAASNIACGEIRMATFEYKIGWNVVSGVAQTPEAAGDILQFGRLDPGVTVLANEIVFVTEAIGSAATIVAIGDQQVANRYSTTAVTLTAAGYFPVTAVPATTIPDFVIVKDVNDILQGTLGGTLPATVGKRFWVRVKYRPTS